MEDIYRNSDEHIFVGVATDKEGNKLNDHTQSAMVVIDHKTGRVVDHNIIAIIEITKIENAEKKQREWKNQN